MRNYLTTAIYNRWDNYDSRLRGNTSIAADLQNQERTLFKELSAPGGITPTDAGVTFGNAFGSLITESLIVNEYQNRTVCPALIDLLTKERYYFQQCLLSVTECDYGLTFSLWVRFHETAYTGTEILFATSPATAQGFQLYFEAGELKFELRSKMRRWFASQKFTKPVNKWTNIAVAWGKTTETLRILVDRTTLVEKTYYKGVDYFGSSELPTALHLGCVRDSNGAVIGNSVAQRLEVATVAMWYWPVQMDPLLTGGLELYLLEQEITTTTSPATPIVRPTYRDFTAEVEEYNPPEEQLALPNPIYKSADLYIDMQSNPDRAGTLDVELINSSVRKRKAYRMTSFNSYTKLHQFTEAGCPTSMSACIDGVSVGFWLHIDPITKNSTIPLDILELANVFRISLYNGTINVFVTSDSTSKAFRVTTRAPEDVWFNLGLAIQRIPKIAVDAYFNAVPMAVSELKPQADRGQLRPTGCSNCLLLGGLSQNRSAMKASMNDLIMWYRGLKLFERHRFVGYTRTQLSNLLKASYYWTPDAYILQDADAQIQARKLYDYMSEGSSDCGTAVPGFSLASIYKAKKATFSCRYSDPWKKSCVPTFEMKSQQYMLLGREKSAEVTLDKLTWKRHCLHDPSESLCGAHGFTISMWLKLCSVSGRRLRFYFNSGDSGVASLHIKDNRGVTIFSDASLIGVSVSQRYIDWKLVLDSTSYKLNQWINVGILWREAEGLTMLVDGVSYGSSDVHGYRVFKSRSASPYFVLGRYDTDEESTWLSPVEANKKELESGTENGWEMAHFVLGEVTYIDRSLTQTEYRSQFGFLGVGRLRTIDGYIWHGAQLVDAPIEQLMMASTSNLPRPGPILLNASTSTVTLLTEPSAVELSGNTLLRLGPLDPDKCPGDLTQCSKGLSVGTWIRLGGPQFLPTAANTTPVILFTGNGGSFGLTVQQNGNHIGAWIKELYCATDKVNLAAETMNMQWIHAAIVYGPEEGQVEFILRILFNGRIVASCPSTTAKSPNEVNWVKDAAKRANALHTETNTPASRYILMSSNSLHEVGANLTVALLVIQPSTMLGANLMNLLGVEYSHLVTLQRSTFFWTFTGIVRNLAPHRAQPFRINYELDKDDTPLGAWCTDASQNSYIALTGDKLSDGSRVNLASVCMLNPKKCNEYVFTIQFKMLSMNGNGRMLELFRSTPLDAAEETVGILILASPADEKLTVIVRNEIEVFNQSVEFNQLGKENSWITLEVLYSETGIKLRKNGILLPTTGGQSSTLVNNYPLSSSEAAALRLIVGREIPVCVSSVSILDVSPGLSAEKLMDGFSSSSCYPEVDYMNELKGTQMDHNGQPERAKTLQQLVDSIDIAKHPCLYDPTACSSKQLITSLWIKIDGFTDNQGNRIDLDSITNLTGVIYTTGPPAKRGVLLEIQAVRESDTLQLNLRSTVQTDTELWQVHSPEALQLNRWTNIGLFWYAPRDGKSGALEIYINGVRRQSSTRARSTIDLSAESEPNKCLNFSVAYVNSPGADPELSKAIPSGVVSKFAFWNSTDISCARPRKTKQKLQGDCEVDPTVPEVAMCPVLRDCFQAEGSVCLDATSDNLYRMASQSGRLMDPMDFQRILNVASDLINSTAGEVQSGSENAKLNEILMSTTILLRAWSIGLGQACDDPQSYFCVTLRNRHLDIMSLLGQLGAQLSASVLSDAWSSLFSLTNLYPNDVTDSMSLVMKAIANALNSNDPCGKEWRTDLPSNNVSAIIRRANLTDVCMNQTSSITISVNSFANHSSDTYGAWFKLNRDMINNDSETIGYLTLINVPGPGSEASLIAGGLSTTAFTSHTLAGPLNVNKTWAKMIDPIQEAIHRPASALRISSPVYLADTSFKLIDVDKSLQSQQTPVLEFIIEMTDLNTLHDVQFFESTGRSLWKAVDAEQTYKAGHSDQLQLAFPVRCVFWNSITANDSSVGGAWDDSGCWTVRANLTHVTCSCSHFSVYAIAKEPSDAPGRPQPYWIVWGINDQDKNKLVVRILLLVINGLSLIATLIFLCTLIAYMVRTPYRDIYMIHTILCTAFALLHASLLVQPFVAHTKFGCQAVGFFIHASSLLTASWLLCESIALFRCFILGDFRVQRAWTWIVGFTIPGLILILSATLSKLTQHGGDLLCLPAHESYVFWTMFGTLFTYLISGLMVGMIINCNIETPAFIQPELIEKLLNRVGQLNFLLFYTTASWSAIVLVIMFPIRYLPYIAFAAISFQGTLLFFTLALDDVDIRGFYRGKHVDVTKKKDKPAETNFLQSQIMPRLEMDENNKRSTEPCHVQNCAELNFNQINEQLNDVDEEPQSSTHVHKRGKKKNRRH